MNNNWLAHINPETPINLLAIPGTHDSASWVGSAICGTKSGVAAAAIASQVLTYTQRRNIRQQLDDGVRALDMRIAYDEYAGYRRGWLDPYSDAPARPAQIWMCHGKAVFDVTFESQLQIVSQFLINHPREFVVMVLHQQGWTNVGGAESHQLITQQINRARLNVYDISQHSGGWPTVRDLAGKVLILSRLNRPNASWLQVSNGWGDHENKTYFRRFCAENANLHILLQDRYNGVTTPTPTEHLHTLGGAWRADANQAKFILFDNMREEGQAGDLKVNHLSHSFKFHGHPWVLGQTLNQRLVDAIVNSHRKYRGLLMLDDANENTCSNLIRLNRQLWPAGLRQGLAEAITDAAATMAAKRSG
ncbi:MAG: hypothetical protein CMJ70_23180 [Planctomycetaceae bacterium]|nr:hypothetical protein [Planctomycetaceae bacterium]